MTATAESFSAALQQLYLERKENNAHHIEEFRSKQAVYEEELRVLRASNMGVIVDNINNPNIRHAAAESATNAAAQALSQAALLASAKWGLVVPPANTTPISN